MPDPDSELRQLPIIKFKFKLCCDRLVTTGMLPGPGFNLKLN